MRFKMPQDKLFLIGDSHGEFKALRQVVENAPEDALIIQVGDFGFWPKLKESWYMNRPSRPVYFIDGNHEHFPTIPYTDQVTEVWDGLFYIPRGTEFVLPSGRNVVFMGGGDSVDYKMRTINVDWFREEAITERDLELVVRSSIFSADLLVTHSPPHAMVEANFDQNRLAEHWGLNPEWRSHSSMYIERLWKNLGRPPLVCGHMHRSVTWHNVTILDTLESLEIVP